MTLKLVKQRSKNHIDLFHDFTQYLISEEISLISSHTTNLQLFILYMLKDHNFFNRHSIVDACTYYVESYLNYLEELRKNSSLSRQTVTKRIKTINLLFHFFRFAGFSDYQITILKNNYIRTYNRKYTDKYNSKYEYKPSSTITNQLRNECHWFHNYLTECENKNMSALNERKYKTAYFIRYLMKSSSTDNIDEILERLTPRILNQFELHLMKKVELGDIKMITAYTLLRYVRYFLDFLRKQKVLTLRYTIPSKFSCKKNRSNEYVKTQDLEKVVNTLLTSRSQFKLRNLAILLLITETGCRPIEISNLELKDVDFIESTIRFTSVKSNTRTLRIHKTVMNVLKRYFIERSQVKTDIPYLFLLDNGKRFYTEMIGIMFRNLNYRAFNEIRFSAKSLRHTYATNALNNGNDFDKVSKSMGHKHWVSTMHYVYRSAHHLLSQTLPYDPTKVKENER